MRKQSAFRPWLLAATLTAFVGALYAQPTFTNPLPIPPLVDAANGTIELEMRPSVHMFNPAQQASILNGGFNQPDGLPTYAYNVAGSSAMTILGPTQRWHKGDSVHIRLTNLLDGHTTTHWHGAEVPPEFDGGPHQEIEPGETWDIKFKVLDNACTLWYHPHLHNHTVQHVQKGLSGMIIVDDPDDPIQATLPHTYGVDDIPIIIGDLGLIRDTVSLMPFQVSVYLDTVKGRRPFNMVNGMNSAYLEVPPGVIRLRILNGSTRKGVKFGFSEKYNPAPADMLPFYLIGTDGGYTLAPTMMTSLMNGPGARDEVVIDLGNYQPGTVLYLNNLNNELPGYVVGSPHPAPGGGGGDGTQGTAFLELRVVSNTNFPGYTPVTALPSFTKNWEPGLQDTTGAYHRTKRLVFIPKDTSAVPPRLENAYTIDSTTFDLEVVNDIVCVDSKEIWTIDNTTPVSHPFHIHKIQFRILEIRDSFDNPVDLVAHGFNGPKDDVLVLPGWKLSFLGHFDDFARPVEATNGYMYHCHILTHEDAVGGGMMHQFVVTGAPCVPSSPTVEAVPPSMQLWPNPTTGELFLRASAAEPSMVRLLDLHGRVLQRQSVPAFDGDVPIETGNLTPGLYLVEWRTRGGTVVGKVVVQ